MRYYYPDAPDAFSAKIQFLKEHHYYAKHCFKNTWGKGYVIFDYYITAYCIIALKINESTVAIINRAIGALAGHIKLNLLVKEVISFEGI